MENYTKLSIKYLKFQKKRTILTILGVALASGILFVILTLYFSNFINTRDALSRQITRSCFCRSKIRMSRHCSNRTS